MSRTPLLVLGVMALAVCEGSVAARGAVTRAEVEQAIHSGIAGLKGLQKPDGSWPEANARAYGGTTSLATLALLSAGERPDSARVERALEFLRTIPVERMNSTYAVALQTMALAAGDPVRDRARIAQNAEWLIMTQIPPGDRRSVPGMWSYGTTPERGDQSNSQYALLGLHAAREAGVPIPPRVWALARDAWRTSQRPDGSWSYTPPNRREPSTGSMTCAGISSLVITGLKRYQGREVLIGDTIEGCGRGSLNPELDRALGWLGSKFSVKENIGHGAQYRYYYLYGLERVGRLTGQRFLGNHDWYREGAEALVAAQNRVTGLWRGNGVESAPQVATSFALLFLAKGRAPVLVNKLRHGPGRDWDNDADDVRNLVETVARDWKALLTWQVVDPENATVEDLLQAPIAYISGHHAPELSPAARQSLRDYVDQGGLIVAEACCGQPGFDEGFRALIREIFPEPDSQLHPLDDEHPVWRAKYTLSAGPNPLWGLERGCRTVVIYSPTDLSCFWNQAEAQPAHPFVVRAMRLGQNMVEYATGHELPADKLAAREVVRVKDEVPRRGALRIAKLRHAGNWNVAPLAVPNLAAITRDKLGYDVVISQKDIEASDPNIADYPLIYVHGRLAFSIAEADLAPLRRHLDPGGGMLFADAACGSAAFDASFRKFAAELLPGHPLVPIPRNDDIYSAKLGFDLSDVHATQAAGGFRGFPQLEGVKLNGHWAIIYSKYDIGCALERHQGLDCKGYVPESARRIALNIVSYSTLP